MSVMNLKLDHFTNQGTLLGSFYSTFFDSFFGFQSFGFRVDESCERNVSSTQYVATSEGGVGLWSSAIIPAFGTIINNLVLREGRG